MWVWACRTLVDVRTHPNALQPAGAQIVIDSTLVQLNDYGGALICTFHIRAVYACVY
jgi:hypothetical protein